MKSTTFVVEKDDEVLSVQCGNVFLTAQREDGDIFIHMTDITPSMSGGKIRCSYADERQYKNGDTALIELEQSDASFGYIDQFRSHMGLFMSELEKWRNQ